MKKHGVVLISLSILAGVAMAAYAVRNADSQSIHVSGAPAAASVNGLNGAAAGYPAGARVLVGFGTGSGVVNPTMGGGSVGYITYICGFSVQAAGAASYVGPITIDGLLSELKYEGSATVAGGTVAAQNWWPCQPGGSNEQSIGVRNYANPGGANLEINMWGFEVPSN